MSAGGELESALLDETYDYENFVTLEEHEPVIRESKSGNSVFQTTLVVVSIYVGLGLLSQPFALRLGGWGAISALLVTFLLFYASALFMVSSVERLEHDCSDLPNLGNLLGGELGKKMVSLIAIMELFGSLTISIIIILQQIEFFVPFSGDSSNPLWLTVCIFLGMLIPVLLLRKISLLAPISATGTAASIILAIAVVVLVGFDPKRELVKDLGGHSSFNWAGGLQALGIFAVSFSGHSTLPSIRSNMNDPGQVRKAISCAFAIMLALYSSVAICGYFYWGDVVSPVALNDLVQNSPYAYESKAGSPLWHILPLDEILPVMVLISCIAKVPIFALIIQDLAVHIAFRSKSDSFKQAQKFPAFFPKLFIAMMSLGIAILAKEKAGSLVSLIGGSCSMTMSLLLPIFVFAKLQWRHIHHYTKAILLLMGCFGIGLLVLVTILNLNDLLDE
eukprot:jgi/Picsp_1/4250/NSC_01759-R1_vacuolar amino acid transporter